MRNLSHISPGTKRRLVSTPSVMITMLQRSYREKSILRRMGSIMSTLGSLGATLFMLLVMPQLEVRKGSEEWRALSTAYSTCFKADLAIELAFPDATTNKKRTMKRWMKTQEFKSMVKDELKGLLSEKGYGEGDIIDLLSKAQGMAEDKKDITNFLRVIENIQDSKNNRYITGYCNQKALR